MPYPLVCNGLALVIEHPDIQSSKVDINTLTDGEKVVKSLNSCTKGSLSITCFCYGKCTGHLSTFTLDGCTKGGRNEGVLDSIHSAGAL